MRWSKRLLLPLVASLMAAACEDTAGPAVPAVEDLDVVVPALASMVEPPLSVPVGDAPAFIEDPGDELPDGFLEPAGLLKTRLDAGFSGNRAFASAMMQFWGNRGEQKVDMRVLHDGTLVGTKSAKGRKSEIFPGVYRIDTGTAMYVSDDCGHAVDADSDHSAWHAWGDWEWDTDSQQNNDADEQPVCMEEVDQKIYKPGSGGSDYKWYVCYYTHYYDGLTGDYLYTEFHGCEPL